MIYLTAAFHTKFEIKIHLHLQEINDNFESKQQVDLFQHECK